MTTRYITVNTPSLTTGNGDNTFIAPGVVINDGIDMRGSGIGSNGGDQTVTVYGTLFGSLDDYSTSLSGNDQIFIGPTGSVNTYWFGAIILGGGGHVVVNAGTVSSMSYGNAIEFIGSVGAHQTDRDYITNTGTISSISLHPDRSFTDATIYAQNAAAVTLTNSGSILSSIGYALALTSGDDVVTNTGFVQGAAFLSVGDDVFDSRKGTITGEIRGYDGNDKIWGSSGDDRLVGEAGNDRLDGYKGADLMIGGDGDDTYFVDDPGDVVDEDNATYRGSGNDTVKSSISFDLSDRAQVIGTVETLWLVGTADINGIGTARGETIIGNSGDNILTGDAGNDDLQGGAGADRLYGDDGNDGLNGYAGSDTLYGGAGNDILNGGSAADLMYGGSGNDSYILDNIGDVASEAVAGSGGTDRIFAPISVNLSDTAHVKGAIENLTLQNIAGYSANVSGIGNALANAIAGNSGANILDGKLGNDTLTGGPGADRYTFTTAPNAATNRDTIKGFVHGADKIVLENAVFTAFTKTGALAAANFAINRPADANDYIVYNTTSGALSYDKNGSGAGASTQFATLTGVPGVTQGDFLII
jgi:Ca2+-binding RTX toxin-like protein